ncbi:MAG: hypothetical protein CBD51_002480 [Flavobacteriales bacterium TMED191]|nr:MAG: hypothetical protein CBD51_002480 [Flavobacteriales bacterium TMED191]|tara:strand:+ start:411 stop:887 length:477 start_codon:yes stop_codon:yes gene_type:complete
MKKLLILLIIPFLSLSQNFNNINNNLIYNNSQIVGCVDLDETLIDLVSIFGDTSILDGLLGCAELIPTLESGILSAFLPFDIPLDCNTDLTPFGYIDMNVSDVCECSCQNYLDISQFNFTTRKLIKKLSILGKITRNNINGVQLYIYDDGSIEKRIVQ